MKSATRIYGDRMDELRGEPRPVPEERLRILAGEGEEIEAAGGALTAHDPDSGALFAGDVAGIRLPGRSCARPPTPPPEIDMDAWKGSIQTIRDISPKTLCPTHFGSYDDVERHLNELEQRLQDWLLFVEGAEPEDTEHYDLAGSYALLTDGIMRYVQRRKNR
ncbi:MAG: hypothetical protein ACRDSJ_04645 [Rubrobacteraceae bacterium]